MKWVLRIAVLMLVCAPLALVARPSSAQTTPSLTVTPHTGLVGGETVVLAGSGFSPGETVYYCEGVLVEPINPGNCGVPYTSVAADANGAFSVPVTVYRFIPVSGNLIDCAQPGGNCGFGAANASLDGALASITFAPQPSAKIAIKGTVTGPDGNAVANAPVWAYTFSDSWVGSLATATDANGSYELDIQPSVDYTVQFIRPAGTDLVNEWFNDKTHRITADFLYFSIYPAFNDPAHMILRADARLAAGGAITGRVTDTDGAGVSGAKVWAYGPGDTWVASFGTTTAADGSYRIDGVRPADYKVRFMPPAASGLAIEWYDNVALRADAKSVTVTAGSTESGIDAQLSSSP